MAVRPQSPWSEPSFFCIQPMVIKQALHATDAGKGAITAAYGTPSHRRPSHACTLHLHISLVALHRRWILNF